MFEKQESLNIMYYQEIKLPELIVFLIKALMLRMRALLEYSQLRVIDFSVMPSLTGFNHIIFSESINNFLGLVQEFI